MTDSLKDTIVPKSDQLNYDDLVSGPITVQVTSLKRGTPEQPVDIGITGHQPFKPCKSMRRVLIAAWGDKGADWIGRWMTLYGDASVRFGGVAVGGIRISHLSHIEKPMDLLLTTTRAKRGKYHVDMIPAYPKEEFDKNLPAWRKALASKRVDAASLQQLLAPKGLLTEEQLEQLK